MVTPAEPVLKTKMEDMGSIRGPRKPKAEQQLRPTEIIKQSAAKEAPGMNPDQVLGTLNALVQQGAVKLDGERVNDKSTVIETGKVVVAQVGKRKFARVTVS